MFRLTSNPASGSGPDRVIRAFHLLLSISLLGLVPLSAQTVATYDFESGNTDGWVSFYNASTPVSTNAAAYTGSYSLLTTTSATGTGGPSIPLTGVLQAGATYTITGWVMLTSGLAPARQAGRPEVGEHVRQPLEFVRQQRPADQALVSVIEIAKWQFARPGPCRRKRRG